MEALNLVYTADPALVLLDLSMPVMDGLTALARIRKSPHAGRIPVIVMSAANERPLVLQAAKLGIAGYILKSQFSIKTMMQRISDALKTSNTNAIAAAP
jgi:CheY-like chemotaxis protein